MGLAQQIKERAWALSALALRQGLALVMFGWGFDIFFNPSYYAKLLREFTPNPAVPTVLMVVLLGLAGLLMTGLLTRVAAAAAAALFAVLLVTQSGHQPVGLPQNIGLAGAAIALALVGPGELALRGRTRVAALTPRRALYADVALRVGLGMTFLIYGIQKFTEVIEYRIVVAEVPTLAPAVALLGAEHTVYVVGVMEIAVAIALLIPRTVALGALGQGVMLLGLVTTMGYPFSYPQDLGLLAAVGVVTLSVWSTRQPVEVEDEFVVPTPVRAKRAAAKQRTPVPQPVPAN